MKTNTPFLYQTSESDLGKPSPEDKVVTTIQLPSSVQVDPSVLHISPTTPPPGPLPDKPAAKSKQSKQSKQKATDEKARETEENRNGRDTADARPTRAWSRKDRPAALRLPKKKKAEIYASNPVPAFDYGSTRPATGKPRVKHRDSGPSSPEQPTPPGPFNDSIQLYDLLAHVNNSLIAEMERHPEVHEALTEELRGPLGPLGPVGRLVRLLYRATERQKHMHLDNIKRNELLQRGLEEAAAQGQIAPGRPYQSATVQAARDLFSAPVMHFTKPAGRASKNGTDAQTSIFEDGIPVTPTGASSGDEGAIWRALQRSDRLAQRQGRASSYTATSSNDDDTDASDIDLLHGSPSVPGELARRRRAISNRAYRSTTSPILEEPWEDTDDETCTCRRQPKPEDPAALALAMAQSEERIQQRVKQAQEEAAKAAQLQIAQVCDERDAALYLAEKVSHERDVAVAELAEACKENNELRTLLQALVDGRLLEDLWDANEQADDDYASDEEGSVQGQKKKGERSEESLAETPHSPTRETRETKETRKKEAHTPDAAGPSNEPPQPTLAPALAVPQQPLPPRSPLRPTSSTSAREMAERRRLLDETRHMLNHRPPLPHAPPPTPARPYLDKVYKIKKTRPALGGGFFASLIDVFVAIGLRLYSQIDNMMAVGDWIGVVYLAPLLKFLEDHVVFKLWDYTFYRLHQRWKQWNQARNEPGHPSHGAFAGADSQAGQNGQHLDAMDHEPPPPYTPRTPMTPMTPMPGGAPSPAAFRSRGFLPAQPATPLGFGDLLRQQKQSLARAQAETQLASQTHPAHELSAYALNSFPRDALADLAILLFVVVTGLVLASAIIERNLWLDHNADFPRRYLYNYIVQYHRDTDSCSAHLASIASVYNHFVPFAPSPTVLSPYHWCFCVPTFVDPRMISLPASNLVAYYRDLVRECIRVVTMRVAVFLYELGYIGGGK